MDLEILRKKLDTYRNSRGRIVNVPDELRMEVLSAWENWKGKAADFYRELGCSYKGMGSMIGKAKKLRRGGHFPAVEFKEVKIAEGSPVQASSLNGCNVIELNWESGRIIRFGQVEQLIDFLKKAA